MMPSSRPSPTELLARLLLGALLAAPWAAGCIADAQEDRCVRGAELCGGACVDLDHDVAHCGACGRACDVGFRCDDGECRCDLPYTQCTNGCFDLSRDPDHCGTCDVACAPGIACVDGSCEGDCAAGLLRCDGRCVDPRNNPEHCGGCGQVCGAGEACIEGAEGPSCTCAPNVSWPCPEAAVAATGQEARLDVADVVTLTTSDGDSLVVVAGVFGGAPVDFGGQVASPVGSDDLFIAAYTPELDLAWLYTIGASGRTQQAHDLEVAADGTLYFVAAIRVDGGQNISPADLPVANLRGAFQGALIEIDPRLGATSRVPRVALVQGTSGNQYLDAAVVVEGEVLVVGHQNGDTAFLDGCTTTVGRNAFVATLDPQTAALTCHGLLSAGNPNNTNRADPNDLDLEVDATGALHVIGSATEAEVRPADGNGPPLSLQLDGGSTTTTGFDVVYRPVGNGYVFDRALILGDPPGNRAARLLRGARADDGALGLAGWFTGNAQVVVRRDGPPDVVCAANLITGTSRQAVVLGLAAGSDCPTWAWSSGGTGNDSAHVIDPIPGGFLVLGEYDLRISAGSLGSERPEEGQGYFLLSFSSSGTPRWLLGDQEGGGVPSISRRGGVAALVGSDDVELFWAGRQSAPGPSLPAWTDGTGQSFLARLRLGL